MEMAVAVAGFSPAEADELRQAMAAKRSELRMMKLKSRFYAGMAANGITGARGRPALRRAVGASRTSASPSRTRSPSPTSSTARRGSSTTTRRPSWSRCSNAQPLGFWSPQSLVADAQRHGVTVRRPDVNRSAVGAHARGAARGPGGAPRPRRRCARSATELADAHRRGRAVGAGAEDLVRRAGCPAAHLEALAAAGALDRFGSSRRALTWSAGAAAQGTVDRLPGVVTGRRGARRCRSTSEMERVADDLWSLGLTPEATAMALVRDELDGRG